MNVGVVETRHRAPAMQIDHLGLRTGQLLNLRIAADRNDVPARDRKGFSLWLLRILRPDLAMHGDQVHLRMQWKEGNAAEQD